MKIPVTEVQKGMKIVDGDEEVEVAETWPDRGDGLGVVIKGRTKRMNLAGEQMLYFRRFLDPATEVEKL